jgi:hypothetical protein
LKKREREKDRRRRGLEPPKQLLWSKREGSFFRNDRTKGRAINW